MYDFSDSQVERIEDSVVKFNETNIHYRLAIRVNFHADRIVLKEFMQY